MKDQKPFIIGLGLGVLIIAGIALTKPKQPKKATAPAALKPSQVLSKPKPEEKSTSKPKSEVSEIASEPKSTEASVMALIDAVDEPTGKIRVLTGIALSHLKASKDAAPLLEALLEQFEALADDAARREALADVNEEFSELAEHEALADFQIALVELEQALNPGQAQAGKLIAGIEASTQRIKALAQIATALHAAGQAELSQTLMEQAGTETAALEEPNELLTANTAMAIAQMNMSQPEAAKQIETLVTKISALETSEDQLAAYGKLTRELAPWATQKIVAAQLERIQASVLQLHYQADPVLRLVSGVEDPSGRVRVLCNLAGTLALTGDLQQSAAMLAKAQEITKDLETPGQLAPALTHLAAAQSLVGRGEEAKTTLAKAMETVDGIQSVDEQTAALGALVAAVESMDNVDHMETVLAQSLKTATAIQHQAQSVMQQSLRLINRLPAGEQKAEALEQIALAIEQGGAGQFAELQFELATLHHEGRHLPKDASRAAKWYRQAAFGGHASAQLNLAVMLLEGEGGAADPSEAFKWLTAAAGQGHAGGQVALGMMLALGQGVEADLVEAHKWVTLSSKSGNEDAAAALEQLAPKLSDDQLAQSAQRVEAWEASQTQSPSTPVPTPPAEPISPTEPTEPAGQEAPPTTTAGK